MRYIQDLEKELRKRPADLEEERKKELIKFIKLCVLESYRNGLDEGKRERKGSRTLDRFSKKHSMVSISNN